MSKKSNVFILSSSQLENFDRENIDELLEIRQICQYFPPSKFCAVRYFLVSLYDTGYRYTIGRGYSNETNREGRVM